MKLVKGRSFETHKTKEVQKDHKEEAKAYQDTEKKQAPVILVTHLNKLLHSNVSNTEAHINNEQVDISNKLYAQSTYISSNFKVGIFQNEEVLNCGGTIMKNVLKKSWK